MKLLACVFIREISNSNLEGITTMLRYICGLFIPGRKCDSSMARRALSLPVHNSSHHDIIISKLSRPSMGSTQPPARWILGFLSGDKVAGV